MTDIYALQGAGNSGKSTTLREFYESVLVKYPNAVAKLLKDGGDFKALVTGVKGKTIGFESQGDPNSRLEDSLEEFHTAKCDLIFCTCRSWGMTVEWIASYCPPSTMTLVAKSRGTAPNQFKRLNAADVQKLFVASGL